MPHESFERLYRRHRGELYRFLLRATGNPQDAEDVAQTAFLNAYRALARGRAPEKPRAWLFAIAENARRGLFRAQARRQERPLDPALPAAEPEIATSQIRQAIARLPFNQRTALVLRELGGLSYSEIARQLGVSLASVQMLLFRARRSLRDELAPEEPARRRFGGLVALPVPSWLNVGSSVTSSIDVDLAARAAAVVGAAAIGGVGLAAGTGALPLPQLGGEHETPLAHVRSSAPRSVPAERVRVGLRPVRTGRPSSGRAIERAAATEPGSTDRRGASGGGAPAPASSAPQAPRGAASSNPALLPAASAPSLAPSAPLPVTAPPPPAVPAPTTPSVPTLAPQLPLPPPLAPPTPTTPSLR
jgi:RNA polymerase sigma-70 factor (ECF subfamily)